MPALAFFRRQRSQRTTACFRRGWEHNYWAGCWAAVVITPPPCANLGRGSTRPMLASGRSSQRFIRLAQILRTVPQRRPINTGERGGRAGFGFLRVFPSMWFPPFFFLLFFVQYFSSCFLFILPFFYVRVTDSTCATDLRFKKKFSPQKPYYTNVSDVPRSSQSWVSTIQTVVLTADVFQLFIKNRWSTSNERVWCTTQLAKLSFNHSIGRTHSWRFSIFYCKKPLCLSSIVARNAPESVYYYRLSERVQHCSKEIPMYYLAGRCSPRNRHTFEIYSDWLIYV